MRAAIRIIVTAVGGGSVGEQVCKALRYGGNEYELIITNTTLPPMSNVEAVHYELLPRADSDDYFDSLEEITRKHRANFIVPGSENELLRMVNSSNRLADTKAQLLANSAEVVSLCLNKLKTNEMLSASGFAVPKTIWLKDGTSLVDLELDLPCIVKPVVGGSGSAYTFIAQDHSELAFFVDYLRKNELQPLIQEYVGGVADEYTVGVLHAPDGCLLGTSVMRRNIMTGLSKRLAVRNITSRTDLGSYLAVSSGISQGEFVNSPFIRDQCIKIAKSLDSRGPLNIQGRWDGRRFLPFEINPRFSGTSSARAMAGFNEPELLIDWYRNGTRPEKPLEPELGEMTRSLVEHFQRKP